MIDLEYGRLYRKEQKRTRRSLGLCLRCGKEPAIADRTLGVVCKRKSDNESRRRWADKKKRDDMQRGYAERRQRRAKLGLCLECGREPMLPGRTLGATCREKNVKRWQRTAPAIARFAVSDEDKNRAMAIDLR